MGNVISTSCGIQTRRWWPDRSAELQCHEALLPSVSGDSYRPEVSRNMTPH